MLGSLFRPLLLGSLLLAWIPIALSESSEPPVEYRVKAAYLYNFTRFIEWPASTFALEDSTFSICLLGKDYFGAALDSIENKVVRGRKLVVHRYRSVMQASNCQVVFVSESEQARLGRILMELRKHAILTVGESENFNQLGGIIKFSLTEKKVRFNINTDAAKRARLTISSKLLNLATIVRGSRP